MERSLAEACASGPDIAWPGLVLDGEEVVGFVMVGFNPDGEAIDWLVGSGGLVGKPTVLMSASPGQAGGMRAHTPLMPTLTLLGSVLVDCVVVSRAGARTDTSGEYDEPAVVECMGLAMGEFADALSYADHKRTGPAGW